jgi:hypothetical protein
MQEIEEVSVAEENGNYSRGLEVMGAKAWNLGCKLQKPHAPQWSLGFLKNEGFTAEQPTVLGFRKSILVLWEERVRR